MYGESELKKDKVLDTRDYITPKNPTIPEFRYLGHTIYLRKTECSICGESKTEWWSDINPKPDTYLISVIKYIEEWEQARSEFWKHGEPLSLPTE
jgi:hypothetical protein